MEIKAEKKYMPQELADRCLKEYQKKEPDEGYWACTPVKDKPDHFVLLGSSSRPKEVCWDAETQTFGSSGKPEAKEENSTDKATSVSQPAVIHVEVHQAREPKESQFDGTVLSMIGYQFCAVLFTVLTLSLAYPWVLCMLKRWETRHTIIDGRRLCFDGTGGQLIGKWILWVILSIVTFGIFLLWLPICVRRWAAKHTHFEG